MKKTSLLLVLLFFIASMSQAQTLSERTDNKVIIGADMFTDCNTGAAYDNFDLRGINQGVSIYTMFNFKSEKSPVFASIGVGYTGHNFYLKDSYLRRPYYDVTEFVEVPHDHKISKINTNYIDIPIEVSFNIRNQFKISAGFKFGILTGGKSKFVGELYNDAKTYRLKANRINNLEKYVYSLTFRFAYRSVHFFAAYQFSDTFKNGFGPEIKPISIGIGVRPF
ncbi:MAG: outer membrane beta-barrel protein [Bacteroidales bacterium]|nr:outer membrane beta-barrel protein [Bacteroidales bacterium]